MNVTERELTADVRALLDQHLDAIERVLADSGLSRSERKSICDEVEAQASEMVWQRAEGSQPTPQLMAAVIAELDDPEAYRDGDAPPVTTVSESNEKYPEAKLHPFSLWALLTPILGFMLMFTPFGPKGETKGMIWLGLLVVISIIFSCIAIREIRRQPHRYYGIAIAVIGAFILPLAIANTLLTFNVSAVNPYSDVLILVKGILDFPTNSGRCVRIKQFA